jgi:hypothetical protein
MIRNKGFRLGARIIRAMVITAPFLVRKEAVATFGPTGWVNLAGCFDPPHRAMTAASNGYSFLPYRIALGPRGDSPLAELAADHRTLSGPGARPARRGTVAPPRAWEPILSEFIDKHILQFGSYRVNPGTRSKSESLLARWVRPWACMVATISASPMSCSCCWLTRVAAWTRDGMMATV